VSNSLHDLADRDLAAMRAESPAPAGEAANERQHERIHRMTAGLSEIGA